MHSNKLVLTYTMYVTFYRNWSNATVPLQNKMFWIYFKKLRRKVLHLKYMMLIRLIFGYYSDIFSTKIYNYVARLYCLSYFLISLISAIVHLFSSPPLTSMQFNILLTSQFLLNMSVSLCINVDTFFLFCSNIAIIDTMIGLKKDYFDANITIYLYSVGICTKYAYEFYIFYGESHAFSLRHWIVILNLTTNYLCHLSRTIAFELMWSRMKFIVSKLTICKSLTDFPERKQILLRNFLNIYKHLTNNMEFVIKPLKLEVSRKK